MGRDKGNRSKTKPSSSSEASDLLYYSGNSLSNSYSGGSGSGFGGLSGSYGSYGSGTGSLSGSYSGLLGSMSAVMGQDAALSSELQIVFKKLYKPSVVTKLKALEELCGILAAGDPAVFDIEDEASVGALLETFGQLYPRLSTDPERGIRERSSNVLWVLLGDPRRGVARRSLGRHIRAVLPAWLCAMNDPAKEVAARAAAAFSVLPPAGQAKAVAFAQGEVAAFLKEALVRSLSGLVPLGHPQTRDDKTAVQDQIDRTFPMYLGAVGTAARILLNAAAAPANKSQVQNLSASAPPALSSGGAKKGASKKSEGNGGGAAAMEAAAAAVVQTVFPAAGTWGTYLGNKNPAARRAAYKLVADLAEVAGGDGHRLLGLLGMEAADAAHMSRLVLNTALGEKEPAAQAAMWGCVLAWLRCMGDAAWAAVAPELRKGVLPRLWALLRAGCYGAPEAAYPCLLVFLSLVPAAVRTEGAEAVADPAAYSFYGSFFGAFWEGLVRCALDSSAPGPAGAAPVAAAARAMCECLRFALRRDAQPALAAWLRDAVLEPLLLAALCDARFRTHARTLAAEAAEAAARILEANASENAGIWAALSDAIRYALGALEEYPRPAPRGVVLSAGDDTVAAMAACGVVLKRIAQLQASPEKDALLCTALRSAISAARTGTSPAAASAATALAFVEETVLPLCPRTALPDLREDLLPWLQQQLLLLTSSASSGASGFASTSKVIRLCVAATRTPEDWEALLTAIQAVAQTPEPFAECLAAASSASTEMTTVFRSHPELVGTLLVQYIEAVCEQQQQQQPGKSESADVVVRALACAAGSVDAEPFVDAVTMEAVGAILLEALEEGHLAQGLFLLDAADIVVRFFLLLRLRGEARPDATAPAFPLLARIFVSSADAAAEPAFRDRAFAVWERSLPAVTDAPALEAVVRLFLSTVTDAAASAATATTEAMHAALGRHIRSLLASAPAGPEQNAFLRALEAEVAACEAPLCEAYAQHLLYYGRPVSAPAVAAGAESKARHIPPPPKEKAIRTYRLAFAAARDLAPAQLPLWLLSAAALVYPVAEIGCYPAFADLREEARRVLLGAIDAAGTAAPLFDALLAKARAPHEGCCGVSAMYALAATELVALGGVGRGEGAVSGHSTVSDAFDAFFLSSDLVGLQYADGALAGFEVLSAAAAAAVAASSSIIGSKPSVVSTAKRLADELISRDFFGLGLGSEQSEGDNASASAATSASAPVLCRTLGAIAAFVRLGAYDSADLARLAAAAATHLPALSLGAAPTAQLVATLRLLDTILAAPAAVVPESSWWEGVQRAFCAVAEMSPKQRAPHYLQALAYAAALAERSVSAGASGEACVQCAAAVACAVSAFPRSGVRAELVQARCAAQALHSLYGALAARGVAAPAEAVTERAAALLERMAVSPAPRVQALAHRILCDGLGAAAEALGPQEDIPEEDLAAAIAESDGEPAGPQMPAWIAGVLMPALARGLVYPHHALGGSGEILPDDEHAQYYDVPLGLAGAARSKGDNGSSSSSSSLVRSSSSSSSSSGLSNSMNATSVVRSGSALDYGCMLAWSVALRVAARLHPSRRPLYALAIRGTERLGTELLQLLHYCLPEDRSSERPVLPGGKGKKSEDKEKKKMVPTDRAIAAIAEECAGGGAVERPLLRRLAAELVLEVFRYFPTLVRLWYVVNSDHRAARAAEAYTRLVNPAVRECQLGKASGRAVVEYEKDDIVVRAAVVLPELYPLVPPAIESVGRAEGLDDTLWRKWQMGLNSLLAAEEEEGCPEGLARRAGERWTDSLDKHFDGIEPCPICYSVFASNGHLPTLKCRVCKHKFHSSCMYKWFSTSHKTTCPLCKSDFAIKGFN